MNGGEVAHHLQTGATWVAPPIIFMTRLVTEEETVWNPLYTNGSRALAKPVQRVAERLGVPCAASVRAAGAPKPARRDRKRTGRGRKMTRL